ncbi:pyrimidine-nucleoside phosphorylase [Microaerobacter geothermalis]|uniref:pyrimidine-nucleoside phosphorylase n=1 Tax=Microaerobacter geothermalis TaxID=674972 RepID=UPI001F31AC40|nr:pyrimidine-nucleoside phosphorylase [Microaerobacter geothermalis]MCF6093470.1 pyrimidine-nucleoside phosphorylase [Microaerobacter geothermalis]
MRMIDLIQKKKEGYPLTKEEISYFIDGFTKGEIPDYQVSALTMAIYFKGMNKEETAELTWAMVNSGDKINLSSIDGIKVDKHSTGGVGDKTSLVLAPLVASLGVPVAKMSGRGLGHTGGTIDKLESIPGFHTELSSELFIQQVREIGLALVGQSGNLTPADKKLYALRDVTATVDIIPLIASSIMSKKIASGADAIVLDVKVGTGAFMKKIEHAEELARAMVDIGESVGRKTVAIISDMNQPLGFSIGNALEVKEAIDTLMGKGPEDLTKLCLSLGAQMVLLAKKAENENQAVEMLQEALNSGKALEKFKQFVVAQGGDGKTVENPEKLLGAKKQISIFSDENGYISAMDAEEIGTCAMLLGAGRQRKDDTIDHGVGIQLLKKVGDSVTKGEEIAILHVNNQYSEGIINKFKDAISYSATPVLPFPIIYKVIG